MPNYCMVLNCPALSSKGRNRMFHMLPRNPEMRLQWLKLIAREDLINKHTNNRVCQEHFKDQDIQMKAVRKILNKSAMPCLHLPRPFKEDKETQIETRTANTSSQTDISNVLENVQEINLTTDSATTQTEISQFAAWLDALGIQYDTANMTKKRTSYRVCSDHFDDAAYRTKRVLRCDALPTLHLGRGTDNDGGTSVAVTPSLTDTVSLADTAINLYDANIQIKEEILEINSNYNDDIEVEGLGIKTEFDICSEVDTEITELKPAGLEENVQTQFMAYCGEFLCSKSLEFIKCQMLLKSKNKQKCAVKYKLFCLDLYYHNPRAYEFLKQLMSLPSIKTLRKIYISVHAGYISPQCLQMIESMLVKMNAKDRCCVVGIGSTNIKKHLYYDIRNDTFHGLHQSDDKPLPNLAKKAYVLVVKGLFSKWRLPVAYALFGKYDGYLLVHWADTIIQTLMHKGFDIRAFISNQDDEDFKRASQLNGISRRKNFFHVMDKKIYHLFDVRHLLRSLRDSFMSFDFVIGSRDVAKWDHILTFYNAEVALQTQLASKLTDGHINPDAIQQKSTVYAAQLFSQSLATAMGLFVRLKMLDEGAAATVKLINSVNDIFDLLNSNKVKHDSVYKRAYTGEKWQETFLQEMIEYFQAIKRDTKREYIRDEVEAIEGFIVTMKSVKDLWKDLQQDGYTYLLTRSLNLDFVKDFFRKINAQNKAERKQCNELTSIAFNRAFYKMFVADIIENSKLNKSKRIAAAISKLNEYIETETPERDAESRAICVGDPDYRINLPKINVIRFIAGYLMRKVLDKHRYCEGFMLFVTSRRNDKSQKYYLSYQCFEENSTTAKSLILPVEFIAFVMKMEERFLEVFRSGRLPHEVGAAALKAMEDLIIRPCMCFPLFLVKKLFVRLRIYNTLKMVNRRQNVSGGNVDMFELIKLDF